MLDNNVSDPTLFTVGSIRETREQVNENTLRIEAMEQRLAALEPQPEPEDEPGQEPEPGPEPDDGDSENQ